jgi:hypothetical protein
MPEPLFRTKPKQPVSSQGIMVIEPYRFQGVWVFDDPRVDLVREPFVAGVTEMIDRLTAGIVNASTGFRLLFADNAFEGCQSSLSWVRADPVEGNWYKADDSGEEGWLCPALFCYFQAPPAKIYVRGEPKGTTIGGCDCPKI